MEIVGRNKKIKKDTIKGNKREFLRNKGTIKNSIIFIFSLFLYRSYSYFIMSNFITAKDLRQKFGWGKNKSYELIKKIKEKFGLQYKEMVILEEYYYKYFGKD